LDNVRNKILDWSLSLQADGIRGEGLSFRPEEKAKVNNKGDTYNIGTIGSFAGNLGGDVGRDINAKSKQNLGQELGKVAGPMRQIRAFEGQMGLLPRQQAEVITHVDAIDTELNISPPNPSKIAGFLKSIKTIAEGAVGNIVASGVVAATSGIHL
jgi:hypothetical protein